MLRGALAAVIAGLLLFGLSASLAISHWRTAALEQWTEDGRSIVQAMVIGERTGTMVTTPDPDSPTGVKPVFQLQPQIQVEYTVNGEELSTWIEVDVNGPLSANVPYHMQLAQAALAEFQRGERIACCYDSGDPTQLEISEGDGGWRTWIKGSVLATIAAFPGLGLVLAGWLLWRAAKKERAPA